MTYFCLRSSGIDRGQIGMNVKQYIEDPVSTIFRQLDARKHENYRGGFEPIPDIVLFRPEISGDWRRRNREQTLRHMLLAIEIKASERAGNRLTVREVLRDIEKLAAHREEVLARGAGMTPVMMVVDVAPLQEERMRPQTMETARASSAQLGVGWLYVSPTRQDCELG